MGIDIGSNAVKLISLKKTKKGIILKKAGHLSYDEIPIVEGHSARDKEMETLRWALAQNRIKKAKACLSLPLDNVYTKYFQLPPVASNKVEQIIQFEARQQIPFPLDNVTWSYHLISSNIETSQVNVVLHAIKNPVVNEFIQKMKTGFVTPLYLDVTSMALCNLAFYNQLPTPSMIVDLGHAHTTILIRGESGFWSRSIPLGAQTILDKLMNDFSMDYQQANEFRSYVGLNGESNDLEYSRVIESFFKDIKEEIDKAQESFSSTEKSFRVEHIYLTGGNLKVPGVVDFFVSRCNAKVSILDPFQRIDVDPQVGYEQIEEKHPFLAVSVGLALRFLEDCPVNINLLPPTLQKENACKKLSFAIAGCSFFIAGLWGLHVYSYQEKIKYLEINLRNAKKEAQAYRQLAREINLVQAKIKPTKDQLELFAKMSKQKSFLLDFFLDLKKITINNMFYTLFQYGFNKEALESYPYIGNARVLYAEEKDNEERKEISFSMKIEMKNI